MLTPLTLETLDSHLQLTQLIEKSEPVIVAYSGGPDSTALLTLLHRLGFEVIAAHLNHRQREEGTRESELARAYAADLGVSFYGGHADVPFIASSTGIGIEEAGRKARYDFLEKLSNTIGVTQICTGHTLDDHLETVMMHILRGSSLHGLRGIPARRGQIVRPLLPFSRAETRSFCDENGLWYHDDPDNVNLVYLRPKLRAQLWPLLRDISPAFEQSLQRLSTIAEQEDDLLENAAGNLLESSELKPNGTLSALTEMDEAILDIGILRHAPSPLVRRALRLTVTYLGGEADFNGLDRLTRDCLSSGKGSFTFPGNVIAEWEPEQLHIYRNETFAPYREILVPDGIVELSRFNFSIGARTKANHDTRSIRQSTTAAIDPSTLKFPLSVQPPTPGAKLVPLGFDHHRKVSDLLGEAGLTAVLRSRIPVVSDMLGPVWIPNVALAERARATPAASEILELTMSTGVRS